MLKHIRSQITAIEMTTRYVFLQTLFSFSTDIQINKIKVTFCKVKLKVFLLNEYESIKGTYNKKKKQYFKYCLSVYLFQVVSEMDRPILTGPSLVES